MKSTAPLMKELSPWSMFMSADIIVKIVMIGLLLASVFSWTLLVTKLLEFSSLNGKSNRFVEAFRVVRTNLPNSAQPGVAS